MADDLMMMNTDDLLKTASLLVEMEDYSTAMTAFNTVFNQDSKCVEAHHIRGYAGKYFENYEETIKEFDRVIELEPGYAGAYYNRGCINREGDKKRAIRDFSKAIKLKSDYAEAYNNRGSLHEDIGNYKQAIRDFSKAIKLRPDYAMAYVNRGIAYARHDKKSLLSISDIKKATKLGYELAKDLSGQAGF
jgi:tetratricopeptide (TPR) repeat protein